MLSKEEINELAKKYIQLRNNSHIDKNAEKEFKAFQNLFISKLSYLILMKTAKYKQFSNYNDLVQDGFEALTLALESYNPKFSFVWWLHKYIDTKIARTASTFSTIRIPMKKAKKFNPSKVKNIPIIIDSKTPHQFLEDDEMKLLIEDSINQLPEDQKRIIRIAFEFEGKNNSITHISETLNLPRSSCVKLLEQAKNTVKNILEEKLKENFDVAQEEIQEQI